MRSDVPHGLLDVLQQRRILLFEDLVKRLEGTIQHGKLCFLVVVAVHDRLVDLFCVGLQKRKLHEFKHLILRVLSHPQGIHVVP